MYAAYVVVGPIEPSFFSKRFGLGLGTVRVEMKMIDIIARSLYALNPYRLVGTLLRCVSVCAILRDAEGGGYRWPI